MKHALSQEVAEKLLELYTLGRQFIHFSESSDFLFTLLRKYPGTIIFVDALDECPPDTIMEVMRFVKGLSDLGSRIKIFISSLTIVDVAGKLHPAGCKQLHISDERINYDISMYVASEVESSCLSSDPEIVKQIKESLVKNAEGM